MSWKAILMSIIPVVVGAALTVFGWWEKQLWSDEQTLKTAVKELQDEAKYFHGRSTKFIKTDVQPEQQDEKK